MNRLFGGRNTGPKPTLNDAIGNVGACHELIHALHTDHLTDANPP
jgi:hypothetical protein